MNKGMLVSDLQAGHPPVFHVGMIAVRDVDTLPAPELPLVTMVKVVDTVQIVEIPGRGGALPVNFQSEQRFVAAGVAGRFKKARVTRFRSGKVTRWIVNRLTGSIFPVRLCLRSLTNVSVIAETSVDWPIQPKSHVNVVSQ